MGQLPQLPQQLREAADAYRPDRERMLARVERAIAESGGPTGSGAATRERPPAPWMRVTAVAAAVAGAIGIGGLAVGAVGGDAAPGQNVVSPRDATSAQPGPQGAATSGTATRSHPAEREGTTRSGHSAPGARATAGHPAGSAATPSAGGTPAAPPPSGGTTRPPSPAGSSGVTSVGSVDPNSNPYWTEDDVDLTSTVALTSLTVEVRVSGSAGSVSQNSSYTSASGVSTAVSVDGTDLVYRWTLDAGHTLPPGTYTFAGQFNHAEGDRSSAADRYSVSADGSSGPASSTGGF
ncbi:hypothetical protein SAMN05216223_101722 [Actinacidiphila yanglinensis]|uniref:Uncharacterized protein n=1 Tax=Actinacidiphila yanglinensis TaxID=310779 RepID=A0A1H5U0B7_9ACTN|nr:hypothetical protein [Actinacidiphila yanglinensis]SEF68515.1 hypothetical protein SAMN05216223_101722 [Actinacidiphila yanglinensis]